MESLSGTSASRALDDAAAARDTAARRIASPLRDLLLTSLGIALIVLAVGLPRPPAALPLLMCCGFAILLLARTPRARGVRTPALGHGTAARGLTLLMTLLLTGLFVAALANRLAWYSWSSPLAALGIAAAAFALTAVGGRLVDRAQVRHLTHHAR